MRKFTVNCNFGGQISPTTIYLGAPKTDHHPLQFQADFISKEQGGVIPGEFMEAISKLKELAEKNTVSFEDLCVYALGSAKQNQEGDPEAGAETGVEAKTDTETGTEAGAETGVEAKTDTETGTEAVAETGVEAKTDTETGTEAVAETGVETETKGEEVNNEKNN